MQIRLELEDIPELDIKTVNVIGTFNNYDESRGILQKDGEKWSTVVDLGPGEHFYKFVINHGIQLNDPEANVYLPHKDDEVWSMIKINERGERLYNNEQYTVTVEDYSVSGMVTEAEIGINKKNFNLLMDKKIVVRFGFREITGLHAVTAVWYDAKGQLHEVTENKLYADVNPEDEVFLWFWIDLDEQGVEYPEGLWTMKLFIDGSYILEDQYVLGRSFTYSKINMH